MTAMEDRACEWFHNRQPDFMQPDVTEYSPVVVMRMDETTSAKWMRQRQRFDGATEQGEDGAAISLDVLHRSVG
jgi:hypothetical protein